jgi:CheY-like chemotaxis protein
VPTILIADDNSNIQKMAALALKDQGYEVVGVSNGEAAVRKLPDLNPDVVLADVFMPVRNGYELCEFIKNDARFAHIPVVLLVGAFDPIDDHEVKRVRADQILQKPFVPPDPLISLVKVMVEKCAHARAAARLAPKFDAERTVRLSPEEVAVLTGQAPPPAEAEPAPEIAEFATRPERIEIKEGEQPLAFGAILEAVPAPEEAKAEEPEAFEASSVASLEIPAAVEEAAPAEPEVPQWGGIEAAPREPAPEEPPIKVEFGPSEALELVTEESAAAAAPSIEIAPPPELATSATEFMEAAHEATPPALLAEAAESWEAAPPAAPPLDISLEETQEVKPWTPPPPPPPAPELLIAAPPVEEMPVPAPVEMPAPVEAPVVEAPAPAAAPPVPGAVEAAPAAEAISFAVPQAVDPAVVDAVVEKVLARLQPQLVEQISREILRPLAEALLRKELEK